MAILCVNQQINNEVEDFITRKHPFSVFNVKSHKQIVAKIRRALPGVILAQDASKKTLQRWRESKYCRMLVSMKTTKGRAKALDRVILIIPGYQILHDFCVMLGTFPDLWWLEGLSKPCPNIRSHSFSIQFLHLCQDRSVTLATESRLLQAIEVYWWDFHNFRIASTHVRSVDLEASVTAHVRSRLWDMLRVLNNEMT